MASNVRHVNIPMNGRTWSVAANVGRFLLSFLELQIPMALGALVCYLLGRLIPASSSYATVYHPGTYLYAAGDILFLTVPVVVWMIVRGHSWRHSLETMMAMIAPVGAIIVVGQLTAYDYLRWLVIADYPAMCLGMVVYMLYHPQQHPHESTSVTVSRFDNGLKMSETSALVKKS